MFQFIFEKIIIYYPAVGIYFLVGLVLVYATHKAGMFFTKTNKAIEEIPYMKRILERIDRNLSLISSALFEKGIISTHYHSCEHENS